MNTVTRLLALGALAAASLTQGCGCSSDNNNNGTTTTPPPEPVKVSMEGRAAKGIIGKGKIEVFNVGADGKQTGNPLVTDETDSEGNYTLDILDSFVGKTLMVVVSPGTGTEITCDFAAGCGGTIKFGDKYPAPAGLKLKTLLPAFNDTKPVNLSTFTTLAAEQAQKALANNANANALAAAITTANGEIANMFKLTGTLSELAIIDVTDSLEVKNAISSQGGSALVYLAALNAAIVNASLSANPGFTLEQALDKLIADITTKGLANNSSDSTVADFTAILAATKDILNAFKNLDESGVDLNELIATVTTDLGVSINLPEDVYNNGEVVEPTTLDAQALKFANVIRSLVNGGDIILSTKIGESDVKAAGESFRAQLEAAELLNSDAVDSLGEGLSMAAEAIAEASDAYHYDATLTKYTVGDIEVMIAKSDAKIDYTVDQTISGAAVKLMGTDAHTEASEGAIETADGSLELSGGASNSVAKISLLDGSSLDVGTLTRTTVEGVETTVLQGLKLVLKAMVEEVAATETDDSVSVTGTFDFNFGTFTRVSSAGSVEETTAGTVSIGFNGKVQNKTGDSFAIALSIMGESDGATLDELSAGIDPTDTSVVKDNFDSLTATLSFNALLNSDVANAPVIVRLATTREGLASTGVKLGLMFGENNLSFYSQVKRMEDQPVNLSVSNQDLLTMTLAQASDGAPVTGSIKTTDGTKELALITETDNCLKVTIKSTGVFVCLNDAP